MKSDKLMIGGIVAFLVGAPLVKWACTEFQEAAGNSSKGTRNHLDNVSEGWDIFWEMGKDKDRASDCHGCYGNNQPDCCL